MPSCERCWADSRLAAFGGDDCAYRRLLQSRNCTPEEQAGENALTCATCGRRTIHQHVRDWCMACNAQRTSTDV